MLVSYTVTIRWPNSHLSLIRVFYDIQPVLDLIKKYDQEEPDVAIEIEKSQMTEEELKYMNDCNFDTTGVS